MLPNDVFDLIHAIEAKSEGLAAYEMYIKDAKGCQECTQVWQQLKQRDEEDLKRLTSELERHAKSGHLTQGAHRTGTTSTTHTQMR